MYLFGLGMTIITYVNCYRNPPPTDTAALKPAAEPRDSRDGQEFRQELRAVGAGFQSLERGL